MLLLPQGDEVLQQLSLHTKLSPKFANTIMPNIDFTIVQGTAILVKASSLLKKY
jgi:hypothetical protein